jgi:transcriptional regulator with PAS, ATPase and Fis domain
VLRLAERVARTHSSPALILGESGVGKEIVATHIHESSARRGNPCVRVNLAASPDSMIEAELFGSVKGAFTGASGDRVGLIASADGGTLLLDEFCEFKPALQSKLLRVLEERRFFPVGSDRQRAVDVRLVAATNRDPERAIAEGALRRDLYYRISTVVIQVPPLRQRPEDIPPLARRFADRMALETRGRSVEIAPAAYAALGSYHWPGNVRELKNVVERAVIMSDSDVITDAHLRFGCGASPPREVAVGADAPLELEKVRKRAIASVERQHIERVLRFANGSQSKAAKLLGVSRTTLWTKLKRYGLGDAAPGSGSNDIRRGSA